MKTFTKKYCSVLLIISVLLTMCALTGCGAKPEPSNQNVAGNTDVTYDETDLIREENRLALDAELEAMENEEVVAPNGLADVHEPEGSELIVGGFTAPESSEMTDDLKAIFGEAVEGTEYADFVAEGLMGTQVVAGINYRFSCKDTEGNTWVLVIFKDLEQKCSVLEAEKVIQ